MGPAALEQFAQRVTEQLRLLFPLQRQRNVGNLSEDVGSWTIVRRSMRQHYKLFKRTLPCETQVPGSNFKNFFHPRCAPGVPTKVGDSPQVFLFCRKSGSFLGKGDVILTQKVKTGGFGLFDSQVSFQDVVAGTRSASPPVRCLPSLCS